MCHYNKKNKHNKEKITYSTRNINKSGIGLVNRRSRIQILLDGQWIYSLAFHIHDDDDDDDNDDDDDDDDDDDTVFKYRQPNKIKSNLTFHK